MKSRATLMVTLNLVIFTILSCALASVAGAISDSEELGRFGSEGSGAGQFKIAIDMASDPNTGDLYLIDNELSRVVAYSAWGEFIHAFGWGVENGSAELQSCVSQCLAGISGSASGQFSIPSSIAVDATGSVYVLDSGNNRIQYFTSAGEFELMFGKDVNASNGGDICAADTSDICGAGTPGDGPGEFGDGAGMAIATDGSILVGGNQRIQRFDPDGTYIGEIATNGPVSSVAVDSTSGVIYATFRLGTPLDDTIARFSPSGSELPAIQLEAWAGHVEVGPDGSVFAMQESIGPPDPSPQQIVEFGPEGIERTRCCVPPVLPGESELSESPTRYQFTAMDVNANGDLYLANRSSHLKAGDAGSWITFYGPPPLKYGPPPQVAPEISAEFAVGVDATSATLKAQINPNLWDDTRFYVEFGPEDCAVSSCSQKPSAPGTLLGAGQVKRPVTSPGVVLTDLQPGTTYHYRFVAASSGGGPVFGPDRTFTTFAAAQAPGACANDTFRTGPGARLPDCRAYEMVSPVDKEGGDILALLDVTGFDNELNQAAIDGDSLTYSSYRAFGGADGGPWTSQYLARRGSEGWSTEALVSPLENHFGFKLENEFKAFSADLCDSWLMPDGLASLAPGEQPGFPNIYRRGNCPRSYEALTTAEPQTLDVPELQGFTPDGRTALVRTFQKLTEDARGGGASQLYEAREGLLKAVCIFPEGTPAKLEGELSDCSAGSIGDLVFSERFGRTALVDHAISDDGRRIYWSAVRDRTGVPGRIYLRLDGTTTLPVSETQTTKDARFWGASPDGSKALFLVEDPSTVKDRNLYLYEFGEEPGSTKPPIAGKVMGVAATSEDLSRVYFVSKEALDGAAVAGKPNLYLAEGENRRFIATLSSTDTDPVDGLSNTSRWPVYRVASTTPDGSRLAFTSTERLTGADNTDLATGEAASGVFIYDAESGELSCASCSPAGARPRAQRLPTPGAIAHTLLAAATVPAGESNFYQPRALSEDGSRLFFTSYADLLPTDTNGRADVYEWVRPGAGSCSEAAGAFSERNDGCVYLISSGESPFDSELVDSSPDGRDAFIATSASLLPQDPGLIDIYDARVGGGFAAPQGPPASCEGEACQGPYNPPADPTPASSSFQGAGNVKPPKQKTKKAKKHRKKAKGKKHKHRSHGSKRAANDDRRQSR